ncbi:MAG: hypothetical protein WD875_14335 [Pirellulales bacterium]
MSNRSQSRPDSRRCVAALAALALVLALGGIAQACPTCGSGMADGSEAGQKMLNGWFWSIVFMMSMPFAIVASLGGYMYWIVRKSRQALSAATPAATPVTSRDRAPATAARPGSANVAPSGTN